MELESIKKIYNGYSNVYDALFKRFFYPRIRYAIFSMDIKPGEKILDVGVGTGLSLTLFPSYAKIVGIDLSEEMLKKAKEKVRTLELGNIHLFEMDAMNMSFGDDSFDKVFISHVVSVVPDPYKAMNEIKRVCKKGGKITIVNHFKSKNMMLAGIEKMINPISKKIGWRSDMCMDEFISKANLKVERTFKLRKVDFWQMIFATNDK